MQLQENCEDIRADDVFFKEQLAPWVRSERL